MIKTYKIEITDKFITTTMEVVVDDFLSIVKKKRNIGDLGYEYTDLSIRNSDGSPVSENQIIPVKIINVNGKMQNLLFNINELINQFIQEIS